MSAEPTTPSRDREAERLRDEERDQQLVTALQAGVDPEKSFRELFQRYRRRLLAFFRRCGLEAEICHELSQETFLRVYKGVGEFRGEVAFSSWLFRIAANLYRNELRRRDAAMRSGQETSLDDDDDFDTDRLLRGDQEPADQAEPLARALGREQLAALAAALAELPPQMRRAMQLRVYHELEIKEIATLMKLAESTVKVHLHQARKRLRQALEDRFGEIDF